MRRILRHLVTAMVFVAAQMPLGHHAPARAETPGFLSLTLPGQFTIDVPKDWKPLSDQQNQIIALSRDAAINLSGLPPYSGDVLFAANSAPGMPYASVRVTIDKELAATPADMAEIEQLGEAQLGELAETMAEGLQQVLAQQDGKMIEHFGATRERFGPYLGISFRYRRTSASGPVIVDLIQVFRPDAAFRVNLAYLESATPIWKPVIGVIRKSIAP